jgi:hypothetical protein
MIYEDLWGDASSQPLKAALINKKIKMAKENKSEKTKIWLGGFMVSSSITYRVSITK